MIELITARDLKEGSEFTTDPHGINRWVVAEKVVRVDDEFAPDGFMVWVDARQESTGRIFELAYNGTAHLRVRV